MRKLLSLLLFCTLLLLSSCSGDPDPTQPTDETTTDPVPTSSVVPTETQWYNPEWVGCEVITPEEGALILHGNESFQDTVIEGDVYITANAEVSFRHVWVRGNLYVHGKLTYSGNNGANSIHTYKYDDTMCSAYDGIHGEIQCEYMANASFSNSGKYITVDALDYAFETWGKVEPVEQPPTEIRSGDVEVSPYDPAQVRILNGKQLLVQERVYGDVYIPSDGDVTFVNVTVFGNVYVAGKLYFEDYGPYNRSEIQGILFAYDLGVTCEAFDGTHGQITGGPIYCRGYVVANDALDYAFETWGKQ